jgi:hypothetical protein
MSRQIKSNQKKIFYILRFVNGIQQIFEGIKNNQEVDIDEILVKKEEFSQKYESFGAEPISSEEFLLILQEMEQTCSDIYDVLHIISQLASDFYHQKYFNKFLLG